RISTRCSARSKRPRGLFSSEHERGGSRNAKERAKIAPADRLLQDEHRKDREHAERDDLLDDLELPAAEAVSVAEAVRGDRETIFDQRDSPADEIAAITGICGNFKFPYQAMVMKMLEMMSKAMVSM